MQKLESSLKNMVLVLVGVALIVGAVLAYINHLTSGPIAEKAAQSLAAGIKSVMGTEDLQVAEPEEVKQEFGGKEFSFTIHKCSDKSGKQLGAAVESTTGGFGGDGERIKQVLVTLSSGVDELKAQVFTSSRAFKEATSVTDEYNIKNENAMAIMQRMGNAIKESFINSGFVEWLTDVLRYISSIPNRFERGEKSIRLMAVTVQALVGVMIATSSAVQKASANIVLFTKMVKAGTASVNIFKIAWQWLSKAMMSNPLAPRPEILSCAAFRNESVDPILAAAGRMPAVSAAAAAHILLVRFFMILPPLF
jgi:hypothetical protein